MIRLKARTSAVFWLFAAAAVFCGATGTAVAAPIGVTYGCPSAGACNGYEYAVWAEEGAGGDWKINVGMMTSGAGNILSVAIKDFASSYSYLTSTVMDAAPYDSKADWSVTQNELNANGCAGGGSGGLCAQYFDSFGMPFDGDDNEMIWTFLIHAPGGLNDSLHLKYTFVDDDGKKVGSLGSYDIGMTKFECVTDACAPPPPDPCLTNPDACAPPPTVPEPSTMGMLGAGLIGLALFARKRIS